MIRELKDHVVEGNEAATVVVEVLDDPGQGGANHEYAITLDREDDTSVIRISFQNGPIKEFGINGVTQEALLAIVIDRLRSFQSGPFACQENGIALSHTEQALGALKDRTSKRLARGVEGTHVK